MSDRNNNPLYNTAGKRFSEKKTIRNPPSVPRVQDDGGQNATSHIEVRPRDKVLENLSVENLSPDTS